MAQPPGSPVRSVFGSLVLIAVVVGAGAAAFAYTAGWLSPRRLTPDKIVEALAPPTGVSLGHRRNHAKGVCFTGVFEANGAGSALSRALFSHLANTRPSGASISALPMRMRRTPRSGCAAWG